MTTPDQRDDPDALQRHQSWIISWLWGYRMGRSIRTLDPGLPQGNGWLVVAQYCREFMREHHKVICTIREILETFDQHLAENKKPRIEKRTFELSGDYEMVSTGARIIS